MITVVERSGYSLVPRAKRSSEGSAPPSLISAKAAIEESCTTGAPVWNLSHFRTSELSDIRASSQSGVSWSNSVSAIAAVPRIIVAGVPAIGTMRWTEPGRAIASITERKVDCADNTLSTKPGGSSAIVVMASPLTAHHGVEINLRRGGLFRRLLAPNHKLLAQRRDYIAFDGRAKIRRLRQRVAQRDQPRLLTVAPPRLNGAPSPPTRPRSITSPFSGSRRS